MVKEKQYVPERGDVVWLDFLLQSGHEHRGRRPAVVLSPLEYNKKTGLAIFCPITGKRKGYPFEVEVTGAIEGIILSDQAKNMDWRARNIDFIMKLDEEHFSTVHNNVRLLVY